MDTLPWRKGLRVSSGYGYGLSSGYGYGYGYGQHLLTLVYIRPHLSASQGIYSLKRAVYCPIFLFVNNALS